MACSLLFVLPLLVSAAARAEEVQVLPTVAQSEAENGYRCPMHPEIVSKQPGACPLCNMTLQPMAHNHGSPSPSEPTELQIPMSRLASGTSWQPDATPLHAHHFVADGWMLMLHYNLIAGYDYQGTVRGAHQALAVNWLMLMAEHPWVGGTFSARVMLSAEPFTTGGPRGYPLLLQTGEAVSGLHLHDRQHPHDLFMELGMLYRHPLSSSLGVELYLAAAGEPALGPVAFPHRLSAMSNPLAPLGHHWQDSTHVSFGVLTAGLYGKEFKLEASWFNGREPDERRYNLDLRIPDSFSVRLSFNPSPQWSLQASYGYLKSPEGLEPNVHLQRTTASIAHTVAIKSGGSWSTTAVLGRNTPSSNESPPPSYAALLESRVSIERNTLFGRVEWVQKSAEDLAVPLGGRSLFPVTAFSLGYVRDVLRIQSTIVGIGAVGSVSLVTRALEPQYGSRALWGGMVFLHVRPAAAL